jgi:ribosomal protein L37AE/L43A
MDGIIWLFLALIVALVALGAVLVGLRRRPPSIEHDPARCTSCETPMSLRRVSILESLRLRGVWKCPHCGSRIKSSKGAPKTA